ncbi:hypothetical protein CBL_09165 [Carabus blaptoides fortunei]
MRSEWRTKIYASYRRPSFELLMSTRKPIALNMENKKTPPECYPCAYPFHPFILNTPRLLVAPSSIIRDTIKVIRAALKLQTAPVPVPIQNRIFVQILPSSKT